MNPRKLLAAFHRLLGLSETCTMVAAKLRNQLNAVVATHFSMLVGTVDGALNGEYRLAETVAKHAENFVDVGGNEGLWTAQFAAGMACRPQGWIYDANQGCADDLARRFKTSDGISVVHAAVSDYEGRTVFYESSVSSGISSLSSENAGANSVARDVRIVTLDNEAVRHDWKKITFLKIDAEGNDYFVLRGARNLLDARRIDVVQFECNSAWLASGVTLRAAMNFLNERGYHVRQLRPEGLYAVDLETFGVDLGYANWVAYHDGSEHLVESLRRP